MLITLIAALLITFNAAAQDDKAALVDNIIQQSSIKIVVQSIPQQLAQLPQMLPINVGDQAAFIDDFMAEMSSSYNDANALNFMRRYFIDNGDSAKLSEIQAWLISPVGKRVTQTELLSQQQVDLPKLQKFIQRYKPDDQNERHQYYTRLVNALGLGDRIFALLENLAPKMFDLFLQDSPNVEGLGQGQSDDLSASFKKRLSDMKQSFNASVGPQMIAATAFQFQELSLDELKAYTRYMETDAGQHFNDLSLNSSIEYSTEWVLNMLPGLIQNLEAIEK